MSELDEIIDKYFKSLNEADDNCRRELIKQIWKITGHDAIEAKA